MGYLHIDNLYKNQEILMFKECYALEKIHGTSAHVSYKPSSRKITLLDGYFNDGITFFSGGEKHERFVGLFQGDKAIYNYDKMNTALMGVGSEVTIYGEAYGGKQQGMSDTYGKELKFVAFDVKIGESWLTVPDAADFVAECGLEFVSWDRIPTDLETLNQWRDMPSRQAARNGVGDDKLSEGVVLRPLMELTKNNGKRIISKHKRDEFRETSKPRKVVDPARLAVLSEANDVATEWVTEMRLVHVLDKLDNPNIERTRDVIAAMIEDVKRESEGEVVWSKEVERAIGKATAESFKRNLKLRLV